MSVAREPQILAIGGGSWIPDDRGPLRPAPLLRHAAALTGVDRPKICFVTTAVGDGENYVARMFGAFTRLNADVSHLALFPMPSYEDTRAHLLAQDLIYVSGGSVANLLAVWRVHGLEETFREAWEAGVVLAGQSAGALCWHAGGNTDSFGPKLRTIADGLGLLPYSCGVHYDSDAQRRELLHRDVGDGTLPEGYAADEGVALHYVGTEFREAVANPGSGAAYHIAPGEGGVTETRIAPRVLGA